MADDASGRRAWTFTDLIRRVHDVPGIERIRFATSHPRYFTGMLIYIDMRLFHVNTFNGVVKNPLFLLLKSHLQIV